jgi:hypothetical protein
MNFDIQKFISYNVDPTGMDYKKPEHGCIKCAMVESLGYEAASKSCPSGSVHYSQAYRVFCDFAGLAFAELMEKAEVALLERAPVETVKKFVIDGMLAQGLIKTESLPSFSEELEHAK